MCLLNITLPFTGIMGKVAVSSLIIHRHTHNKSAIGGGGFLTSLAQAIMLGSRWPVRLFHATKQPPELP